MSLALYAAPTTTERLILYQEVRNRNVPSVLPWAWIGHREDSDVPHPQELSLCLCSLELVHLGKAEENNYPSLLSPA